MEGALSCWGRLDVLVNNASSFFPTPVGSITEEQWHDLLGTNLKAPLFLSQAAAQHLKEQQGCIINITDIHAQQPLKNHSVYCIAKAGLDMLTKSLAKELGPEIRVNAVAPGALLWPEGDNALSDDIKATIIERSALKRAGKPEDVADIVWALVNASYVTGQVWRVDGGRVF